MNKETKTKIEKIKSKFSSYEEEKKYFEEEASEEEYEAWYQGFDEQKYPHPFLTVDMFAPRWNTDEEKLQILMVKRKRNPYRGKYVLPGGFINKGEDVPSALIREVKEETDLTIKAKDIISLPLVSTVGRDPRGWINTVPNIVFLPYNKVNNIKVGDDAADYKWVTVFLRNDKVKFENINKNDIAFDHVDIIQNALLTMKQSLGQKELPQMICLLPKVFDLVNMMKLFESFDREKYKRMGTSNLLKKYRTQLKKVDSNLHIGTGKPRNQYVLCK